MKLNTLGKTILLDRYAVKDPNRNNISVGDQVIYVANKETGGRNVGLVADINYDIEELGFEREVGHNNVLAICPMDEETGEFSESASVYRNALEVDKPLETTPEEIRDRVARGIAAAENTEELRNEWTENFKWLMDDWKFIPGGRILAAAGTTQQLTYYNCYVIPSPEDSRAGIFKTAQLMAEIMSRGGGVGVNLSTLRPRRAYVAGVNGRSSGAVSWGGMLSYVTGLIEQGGSRRGALMLILEDWHPDILEFITSKTTAGKITNANISVAISDEFMQAVANDDEWVLSFPDTSHAEYKNYKTKYQNSFRLWCDAELPVVEYKRLPARDLWQQITQSAWASAEPGIWFISRANQESNTWYHSPLIATNPCFTGDTMLFTDKGIVSAEKLYNEQTNFSAVVDGRFGYDNPTLPSTKVFKTGTKDVYKITTREGYELRVTRDHKIMTPQGWVEAWPLGAGDKIHILNREGAYGIHGSLELGRVLGWLVGDGWFNEYDKRAVLGFYGEKRELANDFAEWVNAIVAPVTQRKNREYIVSPVDIERSDSQTIASMRLYRIADGFGMVEEKLQVPQVVFQGTRDMQVGFLQALFAADGTVGASGNGGSRYIRLASSNTTLLQGTQILLSNLGIASKIYRDRRPAGYQLLPDSNGEPKEYWCKASHELDISKSNLFQYCNEVGFLLDSKQRKLENVINSYIQGPREEDFIAIVKSVEPDGNEDVYDITVDNAHSLVANGIVISNCGEQPLGEYSVCNLGAINLAQFYNETTNNIDEEALEKAISYAVRFLDNVIDTTPYFLEKNRIVQMNERRIGLGTMGLAELLIKMGIRYGSEGSIGFIEGLYDIVRNAAYLTSAELAWEKGAYPAFDLDLHQHSGFMERLLDTLRNRPVYYATEGTIYTNAVHFLNTYEEYGMRNCVLLTQAPTGTTGTMVDTSTGIEPFFAFEYYRQGHLGKWLVEVPIVKQWREANPGEDLPEYFVTAMNLSPEEHVRVQATVQKYIDSAISKTCNVPADYTVEQIAELYELMYDLGCKGGTVYRDQSRDEQVLTLKDNCMTGTCEL